ncbi:hypothetical protein [Paenalkalicoccus suaedae]|nr:hypothetical protein [Paenalkalicoccus suaedae]
MSRVKIGDVFKIEVSQGKAYFQYIYNDEVCGELIRILPEIYDSDFDDFSRLVKGNTKYLIHFPLKAAYNRNIVSFIANHDIPNSFSLPKYFRDDKRDKDGHLIAWQIVNYQTLQRETVDQLTEEQKKLSQWGTWNDTLLIERISEDWTLDDWV